MSVVISGTDNFVLNGDSLGTATAGALDYNGTALYFTPAGTQRGVVPGAQFFRLDSGLAGANSTATQNTLGVGVTLSSSTVYAYEIVYALAKTAGTTSHTISVGFGGTATVNNIGRFIFLTSDTSALGVTDTQNYLSTAGLTLTTNAITTAAWYLHIAERGTVSINAGGTFTPQYSLSAAPGGAYTTVAGSYMLIYPIGASGANVNVGTWA